MSGSYAQAGGSTRLGGGQLTAGSPIEIRGGNLVGAGTIAQSVNSSGVTAPGAPVGRLTVTGGFAQSPDGVIEIEIGGTEAGVTHDQLTVNGTAALEGKLRVLLVNKYAPEDGDEFVVVTGSTLASGLDQFDLPPLVEGLRWEVHSNSRQVTLRVLGSTDTPTASIFGVVEDPDGGALTGLPVYAAGMVESFAGLRGDYFHNADFTSPAFTRLDAVVDFNWGAGSPDPAIAPDSFSARWTGEVTPLHTEDYTFYTVSDDGIRLWVNDQLVIENWTDHGASIGPRPAQNWGRRQTSP